MTQRIDLMEEFVSVFDHEEMVAFFAFECPGAGTATLHGLCRISKPKTHATMSYLSLTFMVDTPDDRARSAIDILLGTLEGEALPALLPTVTSVMSMPVGGGAAETYVRQIDVMLEDRVDPGRFFIRQRLLPAIGQLAQVSAGEIVWWGELAEEETAATSGGEQQLLEPQAQSLAERLKKRLRSGTS